jgi:signal transduction histidine kinase
MDRDVEWAPDLARRAAVMIDNARLYRASQEAVRLREEFLVIAGHELYTPMTALKLSLGLLGKGASASGAGKLITIASKQVDRLLMLIDELLSVPRLEASTMSLDFSRFELSDVVRDVLKRFELDLAQAHCDVSVHSDPVVGVWDRSRLDQVADQSSCQRDQVRPGQTHRDYRQQTRWDRSPRRYRPWHRY